MLILREEILEEDTFVKIHSKKEIMEWIIKNCKGNKITVEMYPGHGDSMRMVSTYDSLDAGSATLTLFKSRNRHEDYFDIWTSDMVSAQLKKQSSNGYEILDIQTKGCYVKILP